MRSVALRAALLGLAPAEVDREARRSASCAANRSEMPAWVPVPGSGHFSSNEAVPSQSAPGGSARSAAIRCRYTP